MTCQNSLLHLKNCRIIAPDNPEIPADSREGDVLLGGEKILACSADLNPSGLPDLKKINLAGDFLVPGFIDNHVHITGGGGESGFASRTPPIQLSQLIAGGITTVVGCLGTDGTTRSLADMLARARGLEEEGISSYLYTGSYQVPVRTLTGEIDRDIIYIDKIIGLGEVALADHRSSHPGLQQFIQAASLARLGGMLSGKSGLVNIHLGSGCDGFAFLEEVLAASELPRSQFLPTHVNRNKGILEQGLNYAARGGRLDFTTSSPGTNSSPGNTSSSGTTSSSETNSNPGNIARHDIISNSSKTFRSDSADSAGSQQQDSTLTGKDILTAARQAGVNFSHLSFSSDGQGSLPEFDSNGKLLGLQVGQVTSLYQEIRETAGSTDFSLPELLPLITLNPARFLGLKQKGRIEAGRDADLVVLDRSSLEIKTVIARGELMMLNGEIITSGTFETARGRVI